MSTATEKTGAKPLLFISYSHDDEDWKDRLTTHLRSLELAGFFQLWDDRKIPPGADWRSEIESAITSASAAVLLISPSFLSSPFIADVEIPYLLARHSKYNLKIFPLILRPCTWRELEWLSRIQCRPKDGKPLSSFEQSHLVDAELANLSTEISKAITYTAQISSKNSLPLESTPKPTLPVVPPKEGPPPRDKLKPTTSGTNKFVTSLFTSCLLIIFLLGAAFGIMGWMGKRAIEKYDNNKAGMAAAVLMVKANPDLELVNTDEQNNSITVKNKKTGETMTISTEDAKNGKFSIKTDKDSAVFDVSNGDGVNIKSIDERGQSASSNFGGPLQNLPWWLPVYPGGTVSGTFDTNNNEGRTAAFTVTTKDDVVKMLDFYESKLKESGLVPERNNYDTNGQKGGTVRGKSADDKRQASVMVSTNAEGTQAVVSFTEKKQ